MAKIKIFTCDNEDILSLSVNKFEETHHIIDYKYSTTSQKYEGAYGGQTIVTYSVLVIYVEPDACLPK